MISARSNGASIQWILGLIFQVVSILASAYSAINLPLTVEYLNIFAKLFNRRAPALRNCEAHTSHYEGFTCCLKQTKNISGLSITIDKRKGMFSECRRQYIDVDKNASSPCTSNVFFICFSSRYDSK